MSPSDVRAFHAPHPLKQQADERAGTRRSRDAPHASPFPGPGPVFVIYRDQFVILFDVYVPVSLIFYDGGGGLRDMVEGVGFYSFRLGVVY